MFKHAIIIFAVTACAVGKPHLLAAPAAVVAAPAPFVTATSSQVIARNYNGLATAPLDAPVAAPLATQAVAPVSLHAPAAAYMFLYSHSLAFSAPYVANAAALTYAPAAALW